MYADEPVTECLISSVQTGSRPQYPGCLDWSRFLSFGGSLLLAPGVGPGSGQKLTFPDDQRTVTMPQIVTFPK
jgi:hypothetical protein